MDYPPMLAKEGTENLLNSKDYIFEPKLDGYRAICIFRKGNNSRSQRERNRQGMQSGTQSLQFISRNGNQLGFPIKFKLDSDCVLDGEIISYNKYGNPDFNLLRTGGFPVFVAFDILEKDGEDFRDLPLLERKQILAKIIKEQEQLQLGFFSEKGDELMDIAKKRGIEGVIAKRKNGTYIGMRSNSWLKIKLFRTIDCIILGYNQGKRKISSLKVGLYDGSGNIVEIGNVGTGFTEEVMDELWKELNDKKRKQKLVCEVRYHEFYKALRAPVFLRLRDDKLPEECTIDQLQENEQKYLMDSANAAKTRGAESGS